MDLTPHKTPPRNQKVIAQLKERFAKALELLWEAKEFAKSSYQTDVFQLAETLMATSEGMDVLFEHADHFDEVGLFYGGPWNDPSKLQAPLVAGCLRGSGVFPIIEILSDLRMLSIAKGNATSSLITAEAAETFLCEAMALNLDLLFPQDTEQERVEAGPHRDASIRLFALIAKEIGVASLHNNVLQEIEAISAQRPIITHRIRSVIDMASRIPTHEMTEDSLNKLERYTRALKGPTPLSQEFPDVAEYRQQLFSCEAPQLEQEAKAFAESIALTGMVSQHHAVLLRYLLSRQPDLIPTVLGVNEVGTAELNQNQELVHQVCKVSILPATAQSIYGLARMLERGLFSRQEIQVGLQNLIELDILPYVRRCLLKQRSKKDGATANAILLSGLLSVLGHPLGVGQGQNPTCQAARGISLWAQHAPGYLLKLVISSARDGLIEMSLEDTTFRSDQIPEENFQRLDPTLDAVSLVLVPHLDYLYNHMMIKVSLRPEDSHKWVNPALYGRWVPNGFASVFADPAQTTVVDYEDFVRRLFATHHPAYNDAHPLMYPNPVGLCITDGHGNYLGPHAISLLRIQEDPSGILRAYFFNPNNEGRQDWGMDVKPSIADHGEEEGESSLPFHQFASRLYAFHYNPYEEGDAYAVPDQEVQDIEEAARSTWGKAFTWQED